MILSHLSPYTLTAPVLSAAGDVVIRPLERPVARIQRVVAAFYEIDVSEMRSARRGREVAWPRQIAMVLAKELTPKSLPEIGRLFGGRDHTTVLYALKAVAKRAGADPDTAQDLRELRARLAG